jgi:DNA-binding NtrC family response regulator
MTVKDQLDALVNQLVERGILFDEALAEFEKRFIKRVLENHRGNQSRTARVLGIHRNTLSNKINLYRLDQKPRRRRR